MSERNGDKSRFGRMRKQKQRRREQIKELRVTLAAGKQPAAKTLSN